MLWQNRKKLLIIVKNYQVHYNDEIAAIYEKIYLLWQLVTAMSIVLVKPSFAKLYTNRVE